MVVVAVADALGPAQRALLPEPEPLRDRLVEEFERARGLVADGVAERLPPIAVSGSFVPNGQALTRQTTDHVTGKESGDARRV